MARQRIVHSGRCFAFIIEEWVLRTVVGDSTVMAAQLGQLIPNPYGNSSRTRLAD